MGQKNNNKSSMLQRPLLDGNGLVTPLEVNKHRHNNRL